MNRLLLTFLLTYLLTYLLTPWSRVLLEKPTGSQPVKKFPIFYGSRRFITAFTSARHLYLSWASSIKSISPHPTTWKSILILSSHLRLGLPGGLFPSGLPTKTLYVPLKKMTQIKKKTRDKNESHVPRKYSILSLQVRVPHVYSPGVNSDNNISGLIIFATQ